MVLMASQPARQKADRRDAAESAEADGLYRRGIRDSEHTMVKDLSEGAAASRASGLLAVDSVEALVDEQAGGPAASGQT